MLITSTTQKSTAPSKKRKQYETRRDIRNNEVSSSTIVPSILDPIQDLNYTPRLSSSKKTKLTLESTENTENTNKKSEWRLFYSKFDEVTLKRRCTRK